MRGRDSPSPQTNETTRWKTRYTRSSIAVLSHPASGWAIDNVGSLGNQGFQNRLNCQPHDLDQSVISMLDGELYDSPRPTLTQRLDGSEYSPRNMDSCSSVRSMRQRRWMSTSDAWLYIQSLVMAHKSQAPGAVQVPVSHWENCSSDD